MTSTPTPASPLPEGARDEAPPFPDPSDVARILDEANADEGRYCFSGYDDAREVMTALAVAYPRLLAENARLTEDMGYCRALLGVMPNETTYAALVRFGQAARKEDERLTAEVARLSALLAESERHAKRWEANYREKEKHLQMVIAARPTGDPKP